eukprot:5406918-Pleurochrysis_carterae.AAC.1
MSPAALVVGACAVECIASLFVRRHSSHAMFRAMLVHSVGASRVHWGRSRNTSARLWLNLALQQYRRHLSAPGCLAVPVCHNCRC